MLGTLTSLMLSGATDSRSPGAISLVRQLVEGKGAERPRSPPARPLAADTYSSRMDSFGMTSTVVVRMDSSCMVVGRYTRCLAGFSIGPFTPVVGRGLQWQRTAEHKRWKEEWECERQHNWQPLHLP